MKNIIFYQGKTQYSNTGDALINKSLIEHLRPYAQIVLNNKGMPEGYLRELGANRHELSERGGGKFILYMVKVAFFNLFSRKHKLFFLATPPGHQFGNGPINFIKQFLLTILYFLLYLLRIKIIKIGFSIGPIDKGGGMLERWKSYFIPFYYVRDPLSLDLVHRIGIKKAKFFPDLAWTYSTDFCSNQTDTVFFSFRSQVVTGAECNGYTDDLISKIEHLATGVFATFKIVIGYQVKEDRTFCKLLYQTIRKKREVEFYDKQILLSTAEVFSSYKFVLTNRLHVALLGYQYGALPIILSDIKKHMKIKGIFEYAAASPLLLDVNQEKLALAATTRHLVDDSGIMMNVLGVKEKEYEMLTNSIVAEIFE
ncbi:polysaccharide pyruvyl transferase family protein [Sphingobacterium gobiense]|uniref:Polysaccharide pyruvyl transferase domain-containing protein n=1 Tax=Sphingobacterium gobiense TaxID=1382456 RepID=A0A2S9JG41_9SPHI|nr:polysaccharide pyruvyl transferase family protein [Sphingobacterium gobiense]PRD51916.1 hypothetical protein C5749_16585 [Sphingobacterium gobiense]